MKPEADVEDLRLWAVVAATVRPLPGKHVPTAPVPALHPRARPKPGHAPPPTAPRPPATPPASVNTALHRRVVRGREAIVRIDLHGLTFEAARQALTHFILRAVDEGWRAALVITGKGRVGEGMIRRHAPEWLAEAPLREHIAGVSQAHRRHGGEGALYVALKRKR